MSEIIKDDEFIEDFEDDFDKDDTIQVEKEKSKFEKALDWARDHKGLAIASVIGAPIALLWIGAKAFSKTETVTVEKLPDPTIMDRYDRIQVEEHSYTDYKYVLKPEYRNKE